ncbi:MAG: hypothetical protein WBZ51_35870 [Xanthobacteraceae bacterium]
MGDPTFSDDPLDRARAGVTFLRYPLPRDQRRPLKATGGNTDDAAAFLKAMHDVRLSRGPIGPVRLDEYGTPILDIYIRKVARVNGKLANTILKTYPQVSQFWTYDPAQFVTQPTFSRDYPPSKNLE